MMQSRPDTIRSLFHAFTNANTVGVEEFILDAGHHLPRTTVAVSAKKA